MIELLESHGGHLNAAEAGYAGQTEIVRKMLAGEMDLHYFKEAQYGGKTAEKKQHAGVLALLRDYEPRTARK
jgi:hypothetical protein